MGSLRRADAGARGEETACGRYPRYGAAALDMGAGVGSLARREWARSRGGARGVEVLGGDPVGGGGGWVGGCGGLVGAGAANRAEGEGAGTREEE